MMINIDDKLIQRRDDSNDYRFCFTAEEVKEINDALLIKENLKSIRNLRAPIGMKARGIIYTEDV